MLNVSVYSFLKNDSPPLLPFLCPPSLPPTLYMYILTPGAGDACASSAGQTSNLTWVEAARKTGPASAEKGRSSPSQSPIRLARAYIKICPCGSARSGRLGPSPSSSSVKSRVLLLYASSM